jgi:chromosomal replication initiation ATPase DnaA
MPGSGMPGERDLARRWKAVSGRLHTLGPRAWGYLRDSQAVSFEGDVLTVSVHGRPALDWLPDRVGSQIREALALEFGRPIDLRFVSPAPREEPAALFGAPSREVTPRAPIAAGHTFADYFVTRANSAALCAAREICAATGPGGQVTLFGSSGVGKTHLLQALAHEVRNEGRPVFYTSWMEFVREYSRRIQDRTVEALKVQMREARLLAIDDFRSPGNATASADELQQVIDWVRASGGAVLVAGEQAPRTLDLPVALRSRLEHGEVLSIRMFDMEERRGYLETLCARRAWEIPGWALDRIAGVEFATLRPVEGVLRTVRTLHRAGELRSERELDEVLMNYSVVAVAAEAGVSPAALIAQVARYFHVSCDALRSKEQGAAGEARAVAAAALCERGLSRSEAASHLGSAKTSVQSMLPKGKRLIEASPELRAIIGA